MLTKTYFSVKPVIPGVAPEHLFRIDYKDEIFLSPRLRLCGLNGMAHMESESLAKEFAQIAAPILQKRYGNETELEVVRWESSGERNVVERIHRDSEIVRMRCARKTVRK